MKDSPGIFPFDVISASEIGFEKLFCLFDILFFSFLFHLMKDSPGIYLFEEISASEIGFWEALLFVWDTLV